MINNAVIVVYEAGKIIPDDEGSDLLLFEVDPFSVLLLDALDLDYITILGAVDP